MDAVFPGSGEVSPDENPLGRFDADHDRKDRVPSQVAVTTLKPGSCRSYIRWQAAAAWSGIVSALLEKAKEGSVPHINLIAKLAGFEQRPQPPREPRRRSKSLARQLLEEMEEHEANDIASFGA